MLILLCSPLCEPLLLKKTTCTHEEEIRKRTNGYYSVLLSCSPELQGWKPQVAGKECEVLKGLENKRQTVLGM